MRCKQGQLWGKLAGGLIQIRCRYCSKEHRGRVVFHYFDAETGELVRTEVV